MGSMPKRIEPVTVKMLMHVHKEYVIRHPETIESVLYDWIALCIFYGFRLS